MRFLPRRSIFIVEAYAVLLTTANGGLMQWALGLRRSFMRWLLAVTFLAGLIHPAAADKNSCLPVPPENVEALTLDWYAAPPSQGGTPEPLILKVDEAYISRPVVALGGPSSSTALFEMDFRSGRALTYREQVGGAQSGMIRVLIHAYGYSRPEYSLRARSGAPTGEPLTWPDFHRTGRRLQNFWEITVDGTDEYHRQNFELFAEFDTNGGMTALLSCSRGSRYRKHSCRIEETISQMDVNTSFRKEDLPALPAIRQRVSQFISCAKVE